MNKRKIFLLVSIVVLVIIYALQLVQGAKKHAKEYTLKENPTKIEVARADGTVYTISRQGEDSAWILNNALPADSYAASSLVDSVSRVRVLDTVSSDVQDSRFGLQAGEVMVVKAFQGEKLLRTITIGKESATGLQTYAVLDSGSQVVLISGSLKEVFNKTDEELTQKEETEKPAESDNAEGALNPSPLVQ